MKFSPVVVLLMTMLMTGCGNARSGEQHPPNAPTLMIQYGCPACHVIPGVPGAVGKVGPSLENVAQRSYIGGTLQNSPQNLVHWIQHPQQIHPGTAMPEMGVTAQDAHTIASY